MDQALSMFIAQGIKSVRMDDISRSLGVSKRTLYELFGDKEELLYQGIVKYAQDQEQKRKKRFENENNYLAVMLICLKEMADTSTVMNRIQENIRKFYPKVYEKLIDDFGAKSRENLRRWIELCIQQGWLRKGIDIDMSLTILYNTANNMINQYNTWQPESTFRKEDILVYSMITFLLGLSTAKGAEVIRNFCKRQLGNKAYDLAL